jgi:hypothetical protein
MSPLKKGGRKSYKNQIKDTTGCGNLSHFNKSFIFMEYCLLRSLCCLVCSDQAGLAEMG